MTMRYILEEERLGSKRQWFSTLFSPNREGVRNTIKPSTGRETPSRKPII
jgi:hypothetical protein